MEKSKLYIISGCNGAGKTTASFTLLPKILKCREFVNADEIARGLSPFHPESVAMDAGRIMLQRIDHLLSQHVSFAFESTLAARSHSRIIKRAHQLGYEVSLLFFWLESPQMAEARVARRVQEGGHDIPKEVIHRRYWLGLNHLFNIYQPIVDSWFLFDNNDAAILVADNYCVFDDVKLEKIRQLCQNNRI
jgi:predicted ABC-type ATPase